MYARVRITFLQMDALKRVPTEYIRPAEAGAGRYRSPAC